jgi:hypothetical protein
MSEAGIQRPARQLDEFEELVYEYTSRMGLGNEEVCLRTSNRCIASHRIAPIQNPFHPGLDIAKIYLGTEFS